MNKPVHHRPRFTHLFKRSTVRLFLVELILALLTLLLNPTERRIRVKRITLLQIDGIEVISKPR